MAEHQAVLDKWFLRQDIIDQLLESGEESDEAKYFSDRIITIAETEEAEHQSLEDPFDRSVALVLSLVREEGLDAWDIDLSAFLKVFTSRVKSQATTLDLPACGRLIRLSWEVLNHQAATLFERVQRADEEDDWGDEMEFGWEADYDDEAFFFTNTVLEGGADSVLPSLFGERVRRAEGRPVTLGELLSAFKDAADDAEELKLREANRIAHEKELLDYMANIGGRMHNEDLEGDIERCWRAMRQTCVKAGVNKVPVVDVLNELKTILEQTFGAVPEGYQDEAKVSSFIAGLFLTHRGFASISQDNVPEGIIFLEDLRPNNSFTEIVELILEEQEKESARIQTQITGSQRHADNLTDRAKKAKLKEEKSLERAAKKAEAEKVVEIVLGPDQSQQITSQEVAIESPQPISEQSEQSLGNHEWLVE
jgi:chromatin segregation and condensation protein Rec8/ScpA/Scc1 (kleisin family)